MKTENKVELLSPAGSFEKLKYAIAYGADAVYIGGKDFSLRYKANNFDFDDIQKAVSYVHSRQKKIYVAVNIIPHDKDLILLNQYLEKLLSYDIDAVILSDPAVLYLVKKINPDIKIHLSTQANVINYYSVKFWQNAGIDKIILARELSFNELKNIREKCNDIELEIFIHGAMCVSYSGRCLLSKYLTFRDANKGDCAQPCRWRYYLLEEKRLNQPFEIIDNIENKTVIFNSKDLCLIRRLKEIIAIGIDSLKIEGRMKSIYYTSIVTGVYRKVIDAIYNNEKIDYDFFENELTFVSHRGYTEGFFNDVSEQNMMQYKFSSYIRKSNFIANVTKIISNNKYQIFVRNKLEIFKKYDIIDNKLNIYGNQLLKIYDLKYNEVSVGHPNDELILETDLQLNEYSIIREIL